jgi:arginine exporter protein ArgO
MMVYGAVILIIVGLIALLVMGILAWKKQQKELEHNKIEKKLEDAKKAAE